MRATDSVKLCYNTLAVIRDLHCTASVICLLKDRSVDRNEHFFYALRQLAKNVLAKEPAVLPNRIQYFLSQAKTRRQFVALADGETSTLRKRRVLRSNPQLLQELIKVGLQMYTDAHRAPVVPSESVPDS